MALDIGNPAATTGMTKAIYDEMENVMESSLEGLEPDKAEPIRDGWRKLAHAVATGVVEHIRDHAEVVEVITRGDISATVAGDTATQTDVAFSQADGAPGGIQ